MKAILVAISMMLLFSSCNGMSMGRRIKNPDALNEIEKIALVNFAVNSQYTVGSGEDTEYEESPDVVKTFGSMQLKHLYGIMKAKDTPAFLDLNEMVQNDGYQALDLADSYTKGNRLVPNWIIKRPTYISPIDVLGLADLDSAMAKDICQVLDVDGVLSIEVSYNLDAGANLPFAKPNWWAYVSVQSELYNSDGNIVWKYYKKTKSPLKLKAATSMNLLVFSRSTISPEQSIELIQSAEEKSTQELFNALYADISTASQQQP